MGGDETRVAQIALPDGTEVWARVSDPGELPDAAGDGYADTGVADRAAARLESFQGLVTGVARSLADAARSVRPDEVSVEFGIELTARAGKVVGLLADGEARSAIKVTLTWQGGPPPGPGPQPDDRARQPTVPGQQAVPGPADPALGGGEP